MNQSWFQWIALIFQDWSLKSLVRCTNKQPPWQVRMHTSAWQVLKQHTCAWQAHTKFHICPCAILYYLPILWIVMYGLFSSRKSPVFPTGSVCPMSQITQDRLCLPDGSTYQMFQQIKCIHIQVDCRIHTTLPEPFATRFGWLLIVECHFYCQAWLSFKDLQHQSSTSIKPKANSAMLIDTPIS